ncbi:DUF7545 family protein [Halalkalicoccus subterraneus]|uniref:DUF7545 family protein n=1 Tax=Halalkalicoccus subterraneus TaxID=2675002 RepID=UPI000EFB9D9E|nr:hypothetical protein [Halalkalicoccus subterraneus]
MAPSVTFAIDGDDGSSDEVVVPTALLETLADGDETSAETLGDLAMLSAAQQVHAMLHHSPGEPDDDLRTIEEETMALFEDRFGVSFAEMTGHDH